MQSVTNHIINKSIQINATPSNIWQVLTEPEWIQQWILDSEVEVISDWVKGSPITIRGYLHDDYFENKGIILQAEPEHLLQYTHLSSLSRLPDTPESYTIIQFELIPSDDQTELFLTLTNFPTETIYWHLEFYWNVTLGLIKNLCEE
ncbi:SRPBCC domain-containing protein [Cytophagaceae bacterium YF14B1]|uniref:SRPBCC domain-containing protein n=1 Tax=Xanthocytophaga flava TaxID=3048013 RepID=A0AAE3QUR3_9BACT|nr:SRPBCC domain-containing protein [Xanthocytophaga flavus]MDJ1482918.1 SRPBCC domain-containing protein [Xanthocytophaga flavus]